MIEEEQPQLILDDHILTPSSESEKIVQPRKTLRNPHSEDQIIGNQNDGVWTRSTSQSKMAFGCFVSQIGPKKVTEALKNTHWIIAMQKELNQFARNDRCSGSSV